MGNCVCQVTSSSSSWGGDDWGSVTSKHTNKNKKKNKVADADDNDNGKDYQTPTTTYDRHKNDHYKRSGESRQVKIVIAKKEFEEYLYTAKVGDKDDNSNDNNNNNYDNNKNNFSEEQLRLAKLIDDFRNSQINDVTDDDDDDDGYTCHLTKRRVAWRPALKSIPEVN